MKGNLNALPYWFFLHIFLKNPHFSHHFLQSIMHMTSSIVILQVTVSVVAMYVSFKEQLYIPFSN